MESAEKPIYYAYKEFLVESSTYRTSLIAKYLQDHHGKEIKKNLAIEIAVEGCKRAGIEFIETAKMEALLVQYDKNESHTFDLTEMNDLLSKVFEESLSNMLTKHAFEHMLDMIMKPLDVNKDGCICLQEMKSFFKSFVQNVKGQPATDENLSYFFECFDKNDDKKLSKQEFAELVAKTISFELSKVLAKLK